MSFSIFFVLIDPDQGGACLIKKPTSTELASCLFDSELLSTEMGMPSPQFFPIFMLFNVSLKGLFRHRHGKEVLSEETGRGKEVIERREVFDMQGIG